MRNFVDRRSIDQVKTSFPPSLNQMTGFAGLVQTLAPASVQMAYCATNALPYRVDWSSARGPVTFYGLTPDEAANDALGALTRGTVQPPARQSSLVEPTGNSEWAEAMRGLIADIDAERVAATRPVLRVLRGGR